MVGSTGVLSPAVVVTAEVARPAVVVGPSGPACAGKGIAMTVAPSRAATASATTGRRRPVSEGCIIVNSLVNAELSQDQEPSWPPATGRAGPVPRPRAPGSRPG